ncbi:MAG TPA: TetR/AcrR family transcriptional regulator [Solirubrobacterales bacterium]|nr:TetR/AcrR family transcriptional regulator [Solirubrobacterales bacterium]
MRKPATRARLPLEERRALIVEAAGRLFGERGYEGTRLDDVAAAAGVTKPVLYRHFDSKKALYLALLERHRADLASFAGAIPTEGSLRERLRAVLRVWFAYVEAHSYAWKMLFRDTGGGPEIRAFRLEVHARARAVLVEIMRSLSEVSIPRRELEPLAELMSMGMASLVLWWIDNPGVSRPAIVDAMTRVWVGLVTAEG